MNNTRVPPAYPQRVSPELFVGPPFRDYRTAEVKWGPDNGPTYFSEDNLECSSSEIDPEEEVQFFDSDDESIVLSH